MCKNVKFNYQGFEGNAPYVTHIRWYVMYEERNKECKSQQRWSSLYICIKLVTINHPYILIEFVTDRLFNFAKYDQGEIDSMGSPYDLLSVMHYGPYAFNKNGLPTILDINTMEPIVKVIKWNYFFTHSFVTLFVCTDHVIKSIICYVYEWVTNIYFFNFSKTFPWKRCSYL